MIEPIVQLCALVMVIDNETDESEMEIFRSIPKKMIEHLEDRAGVNLVVQVGRSRSSKTKNELDDASNFDRSSHEIANIANQTINTYNDTNEDDINDWVESIASQINGKWIRFHTMKLLVDMAAADGDIKGEELNLISTISRLWKCEEDTLDFLFLKTRTEWEMSGVAIKNTKKKAKLR